jgi:hypothetical protein
MRGSGQMQSVIWAFGSMLALMLIISFVPPLGFTLKGKYFVVFFGFVFALGGNAAVLSIPLWQTLLLLLLITFFAAYIMNNRMSSILYKEQDQLEEQYVDEPVFNKPSEKNSELDLEELEVQDLIIEATPSPSRMAAKIANLEPKIGQLIDVLDDEDISFLQDRDTLPEVEKEVIDDAILEVSYISDIEAMLQDDTTDSYKLSDEDFLGEIEDIKPKNITEEEVTIDFYEDENQLEELYRTLNIDTKNNNVNLDKSKTKRELELQK